MGKLKALFQQSLCRGDETRHRHGYPQEIDNAFPMVTIHACEKETKKQIEG